MGVRGYWWEQKWWQVLNIMGWTSCSENAFASTIWKRKYERQSDNMKNDYSKCFYQKIPSIGEIETVVRLEKRLGNTRSECKTRVSEVPVSPENCTELWWRRGKFLTVALHDVKPSWDLRRYKGVCGQLKLRFSKPLVGMQDRDGILTFLIKGDQFWWVESYQGTSLF